MLAGELLRAAWWEAAGQLISDALAVVVGQLRAKAVVCLAAGLADTAVARPQKARMLLAPRESNEARQAGEALRGLQEGSRRRFGAQIGENP